MQLLFVLAASGSLFASTASGVEAARRPNVLILMGDNWAWKHAGAYGDQVVQTPTFDRLARDGVLFRNAFCSVPSCAPARAVFLTGQAAHRLEGAANLWGDFPAKFTVFTDVLEAGGYRVGHSGKGWGPGNFEASGRTRNPAGSKYRDLAEFLTDQSGDVPFLYWHSSREPHAPWLEIPSVSDKLDSQTIEVPDVLPDHPYVRDDIRRYYGEVQQFDTDCAAMLALLRTKQLDKHTLVLMLADNGWQMPRGLAHVYDWGTRVPLAAYWPGHTKAGHVAEEFVSFEDFAPTFLELAGLSVPEFMTGRSIVPLLRGENDSARDHVFVERERHANVRAGDLTYPSRAIRTRDYLYIRNLEPDRWPAGDPIKHWAVGPYGDVDWSLTKDLLIAEDRPASLDRFYELGFGKRPGEELYDLRTDPDQARNVANDAQYRQTLADLRAQLQDWMQRTDDPRATGPTDVFDKAPYFGKSTDQQKPITPPALNQ
ncbi:MAG: sulfatase [Planctomycetaceae bacterium]|nr:sulfatase [Planctomycetaceae bacterium]